MIHETLLHYMNHRNDKMQRIDRSRATELGNFRYSNSQLGRIMTNNDLNLENNYSLYYGTKIPNQVIKRGIERSTIGNYGFRYALKRK